jgi:hypothetical protein
LLLAATLTAACAGGATGAAGETSAYTPPAGESGENGWTTYRDAPTLDRSSAAGVYPGDASVEAAVTHFYASRLRGDDRYREVLVPSPSDRLERGLDEYDDWTFRAFRLVGKKETAGGGTWVKVWFEIEVDGDTDDGTDDVSVEPVDGALRIAEVPS